MTAFNMTEARAGYLLEAIEEFEGARPFGNTPPFCVALDNDLKAWRDSPAHAHSRGVLERLIHTAGDLARGMVTRAIAQELETLYAESAENVSAMNEMRAELDLLQKRLEQNDD